MLKLLIADDERIIRETLSDIIDWPSYGIEVIGLCQNGIEAYNMILDEIPDIVLTDIRMPGISGLELIQRVHDADLPIQFIILSGFDEFQYAKSAMKYGVKHYLLKPCNENQIIESIKECKEESCSLHVNRQLRKDQFLSLSNMLHNVISGIIHEEVCENRPFSEIVNSYEQYLDFYFTSYQMFYVYYLDSEYLDNYLKKLREIRDKDMPQTIIYGCYVHCTLVLFFQNTSDNYKILDKRLNMLRQMPDFRKTEVASTVYSCLKELLMDLSKKLSRFSTLYYINDFRAVYTCNYSSIITRIELLCKKVLDGDEQELAEILDLLNKIEDIDFLKQLSGNLFLRLASSSPALSVSHMTRWLVEIQEERDLQGIKKLISEKLEECLAFISKTTGLSSMTQEIYRYVSQNLSDPNLTLKYVAENHLFMNVDYVSRKFHKETGEKFSHYLTCARIQKGIELMDSKAFSSVQEVAIAVGFGNNPRYFTQVFKREVGKTPSEYISFS